jgi:hypothetical protein
MVRYEKGGSVSTDDGAVVPRRTDIYGQDHLLAYIRPDEAALLKDLGGAGTPGPGGLPQFGWLSDTWAEITSGGAAVTETYNGGDSGSDSTPASPPSNNNEPSTPPSNNNEPSTPPPSTSDDDKPVNIGQVSSTGQYAGDGFSWQQNPGGYLTRVRTPGAAFENNLGTDVIQGGTATAPLKEKIAAISLDQENKPETVFGESPGSATDGSLLDLFRSEENRVGSGSYAEQIANQQAAANQNQPVTTVDDQVSTTDPVTGETKTDPVTGEKSTEEPTQGFVSRISGYGYDYNNDGTISYSEALRDMTDGGGPGRSQVDDAGKPVYKDAAGNELGQGFGRRLLGGIGSDLAMGMTAGIFTPLDQQAQKLIDAGYDPKVAEDYVQRTRDTMEKNQLQQQLEQQRRSDDDGPAKPPTDPCPKGYIMDPQKGVCIIDPSAGAGDDDEDDDYGYQPPAYTPPPLSPYLDVDNTGGGFTLQPGSEDVSFMRRSGQYAAGGQVGLGSMNPFMGMYKFR